jgi:hypothetical protein
MKLRQSEPRNPTSWSLYRHQSGYISRSAVSAFFAPLLRALEEKLLKTTLRHYLGPWNSGR